MFVPVEDEDDVVGRDDRLEIVEIFGRPPLFEAPATQAVVPEQNDGATTLSYPSR